jgi:hypothetical protein
VGSVPGRYEHNPDPRLAELLHEVTEQGWGDDSVGDLDEDGFHASLLIIEPAEQQELKEAFDRAIPAGNWILTQNRQGFVTVDQYPSPAAARHAFEHLPDLDGPGEEDGTITPTGTLGSRFAVALAGSFLGDADDLDQAMAMLRAAMDADRSWPDAWFISDHGNPTASTSGTRDQRRSRRTNGQGGGVAWCRWSTSGAMSNIGERSGLVASRRRSPPPDGSGLSGATRHATSPRAPHARRVRGSSRVLAVPARASTSRR